MVMGAKVNQYITVALISAKRFKNIIFRLFAVSSFKECRGDPSDCFYVY